MKSICAQRLGLAEDGVTMSASTFDWINLTHSWQTTAEWRSGYGVTLPDDDHATFCTQSGMTQAMSFTPGR